MDYAAVHDNGVVEVIDVDMYREDHPSHAVATCGHCDRSWDDTIPTAWTPTPSGRCPFEYEHDYRESEADEWEDWLANFIENVISDARNGDVTERDAGDLAAHIRRYIEA